MKTERQKEIDAFILKDPFTSFLGAKVEILGPGHSRVTLDIKPEMTNFHGVTHGGVIFAISDMAFAAASNSHGQTAVALDVGINFLKESRPGDRLIAEAKEEHAGGRTALYEITVKDASTGDLVAKSENRVYRKKDWFIPEQPRTSL